MQKKLVNTAFVYAIAGMILGVFYREFTKLMKYTGDTRLSVTHTHIFVLGMIFFLIILMLDKVYKLSEQPKFNHFYLVYNIGVIATGSMLVVRGVVDILMPTVSKAIDASISGISGLAHIILAAGIIRLFMLLKRSVNGK